MTPMAIGTGLAILSIIGLIVGLVVFAVVVLLLTATLAPLRKILVDVQDAQTAPMLERGVKGTDELSRTQQLANGVPPLAVAYLQKLGLPVDTEVQGEVFPQRGSTGWR